LDNIAFIRILEVGNRTMLNCYLFRNSILFPWRENLHNARTIMELCIAAL